MARSCGRGDTLRAVRNVLFENARLRLFEDGMRLHACPDDALVPRPRSSSGVLFDTRIYSTVLSLAGIEECH